MPPAVIREIGPRDRLQSLARIPSTARKLDGIREPHADGQREIEAGSLVPAHPPTQLADTAEVVACRFASMGVPAGREIDKLVELRGKVAARLDGAERRAGLPATMRSSPADASA